MEATRSLITLLAGCEPMGRSRLNLECSSDLLEIDQGVAFS